MATPLTPEILADLFVPSDPQISPDGRWLVASVTTNSKRGDYRTAAIWIASSANDQPARQLTSGAAADTEPRWSSDGRRLGFLSDRTKPGAKQLYVLTLDGGEALPLTDELGGVADFCWLPGDGLQLAYLAIDARDPAEQERRERERDDADVYGECWPFARIVILDVETRACRRIDTGERHVAGLSPSPDGQRLAVSLWGTTETDWMITGGEIAIVDLISGAVTGVTWPGEHDSIVWALDGSKLYYRGEGPVVSASSDQLWCVAAEAGAVPRLVTPDVPFCLANLARPRSRPEILAVVHEGTESAIYRLDPSADTFVKLSHFVGDVRGLTVSDDGQTLGTLASTPTRPRDLHVGDAHGTLRRISNFHTALDDVTLGDQEVIAWERAGFTLDGILIFPPDKRRADGPFPTIVSMHGGPYSRWPNAFMAGPLVVSAFCRWLAAQGYLVFLPNPRGGSGHGQAFAEAILHAVGNDDYLDIMAGVDLLVEQGLADPDRLGCGGWSQGGFMAAWIVGHTERFKAAVDGAGPTDWGMMIKTTDVPSYEPVMGGGNPYASAGPHSFDVQSPISYVHQAKTPILILHGRADVRVPVSQATAFHRGLQHYGVPNELVIYPREPHVFEERAHQIDLLKRIAAWYQRWIPVDAS